MSLTRGLSLLAGVTAIEATRRLAYSSSDPSSKKLIVVKMGGSAITVKNKLETLNATTLDATAKQIALAKEGGVDLALLHGAGSFGHFQARKYLISKGNSHPDWAFGFADTRRAVTTLNHEVVKRLVGCEVPAVGVSPFPSCWTSKKGVLGSPGSMGATKEILEAGLVPVIHGDAVLDKTQGSSIVSGDLILETLCSDLKPTSAVFLTDVPGVFTKPPTEPGAELISEIIVSPDGTCKLPEMSTAEHDVTGGVAAKLRAAAAIAGGGTPVCIVQAGSADALAALAGRRPDGGTVIMREGATWPKSDECG